MKGKMTISAELGAAYARAEATPPEETLLDALGDSVGWRVDSSAVGEEFAIVREVRLPTGVRRPVRLVIRCGEAGVAVQVDDLHYRNVEPGDPLWTLAAGKISAARRKE